MYEFIYSIFETINAKISEHHEANPGFDSVPSGVAKL